MKLTVLVDNNTLVDRYFQAEPGLSFLLEDEDVSILFDTGYSDLFIQNARKMDVDLKNLDYVVLSHSHLDHTWGLDPLIRYFTELTIEKIPHKKPTLVAHPEVFTSAGCDGLSEFGSLISKEKLARHFDLDLCREPRAIGDKFMFLGEIPRKNDFEGLVTFGRKDGADEDDKVMDDSALVYKSSKGLVMITGCSHAGICNMTEYARDVCGETRVDDIIGGLHLMNPSKEQLTGTLEYLKKVSPNTVHACHCTDLPSKIALAGCVDIVEVGVGLTVSYD